MNSTTTLSISSDKFDNCDEVMLYFRHCGIPCDITQNKSIIKKGDSYQTETGCRILFTGKKKVVTPDLWESLKNKFNLKCAHIKIDGQFKGCIYDYIRPSSCPGGK